MDESAVVLYLVIMLYVTLAVLKEIRPARGSPDLRFPLTGMVVWYIAAFASFSGGQLIFFLASQPLCMVRNDISYKRVTADYCSRQAARSMAHF